jgi:hypothetical protein
MKPARAETDHSRTEGSLENVTVVVPTIPTWSRR